MKTRGGRVGGQGMGVLIGMFAKLARLGGTRAAAFFYAVAVGITGNVVIQHFTPDATHSAPAEVKPAAAKAVDVPVATATIVPKPAPPAEAGAAAALPASLNAPTANAAAPSPVPGPAISASLPAPAAMAA